MFFYLHLECKKSIYFIRDLTVILCWVSFTETKYSLDRCSCWWGCRWEPSMGSYCWMGSFLEKQASSAKYYAFTADSCSSSWEDLYWQVCTLLCTSKVGYYIPSALSSYLLNPSWFPGILQMKVKYWNSSNMEHWWVFFLSHIPFLSESIKPMLAPLHGCAPICGVLSTFGNDYFYVQICLKGFVWPSNSKFALSSEMWTLQYGMILMSSFLKSSMFSMSEIPDSHADWSTLLPYLFDLILPLFCLNLKSTITARRDVLLMCLWLHFTFTNHIVLFIFSVGLFCCFFL